MKNTFLAAVIAAIAAQSATFATESATPVAQPSKPNIVVILADDLGYGDAHCFDPKHCKITTPNIPKSSNG